MAKKRLSKGVRQRADGTFEARRSITDTYGRPRRPSGYGATEDAALADLSDKCRALELGKPIRSSTVTIAAVAREWRDVVLAGNPVQNTRETFDSRCRNHIEVGVLADVQLKALDANHIRRWLNTSKAAESSKRQDLIILRAVLDYAIERKLLIANVAREMSLPKVEQTEADTLAISEITEMLADLAVHTRYATAIRLTALTGARRGEILALRWRDIDLSTGNISINGTIVGSGKTLSRQPYTKGKKKRSIQVPSEMVILLKAHKAAQAAEKLASIVWGNTDNLAFTTSVGTLVDGRNLLRSVQKSAHRLGLDDGRKIGIHTLRHSTATHLIYTAGVPVDVVQRLLGHADVETTLRIYGHPSALDVAAAVSNMGAALSGVATPESTPESSETDPPEAATETA